MRNDEVVIIDEFTGRMMPGRRFFRKGCTRRSKPRKKGPRSSPRTRPWPQITFQNYFRLYEKLAA